MEEKAQLVQFEMLINKNNKHLVHHLLAYECEDNFVPNADGGRECGTLYKLKKSLYHLLK